MNSTTWMQVAALVYLLLSVGVLWVVFVMLRGFVRLLVGGGESGRRSLLGGDARTRLLGLAITAIIFTPLLGRLVRAFIRLCILLFDRVPRHMLVRWRTQSDFCQGSGADCLTDTVLVLVNATAGGISAAVRDSGILGIGIGYVVLWLAMWVLATALLNTLKANADPGEPFDLRELLLGDAHEVTRKNFLFFLVLFVGAYLSLASIAAIPDLRADLGTGSRTGIRDVKSLPMVKAEWDVRLDTVPSPLRLVDSVFYPALAALAPRGDATPAAAPAADTMVRIRPRTPAGGQTPAQDSAVADTSSAAGAAAPTTDSVAALAAPPAASGTAARRDTAAGPDSGAVRLQMIRISRAIPPAHVAALHAQSIHLRTLWNQESVRHDSVVRTVLRRRSTSTQLADAVYADADTTRRLGEQRTYFHKLQRWLAENDASLRAEFDHSWVSRRRLQLRLEGWSTAAAGYLTGPVADSAQLRQLTDDAVRLRSEEWMLVPPEPASQPRIPERGEGLGPFRYVSGWLLKTDSMPLTLIVGMLGFGLLGAAASTFVRDQTARQRQEEKAGKASGGKPSAPEPASDDVQKESEKLLKPPAQPLVRNLPSVVIRGGSAAIVVFLGIMGGLSVFTQEADPNPYALLFTCLVGAVFSEQVWVWAEKRFGMSFNRDGGDDDEGEKGAAGDDPAAAKPDATKASRVYVIVAKPSDVVVVQEGEEDAAPRARPEEVPVTTPAEDARPTPRRRRGGFRGRILGRRKRRSAPEPPPAAGA